MFVWLFIFVFLPSRRLTYVYMCLFILLRLYMFVELYDVSESCHYVVNWCNMNTLYGLNLKTFLKICSVIWYFWFRISESWYSVVNCCRRNTLYYGHYFKIAGDDIFVFLEDYTSYIGLFYYFVVLITWVDVFIVIVLVVVLPI